MKNQLVFIGLIILTSLFWNSLYAQVGAITGIEAIAYDHHIELIWEPSPNPTVSSVRIFGTTDGTTYSSLGNVSNFQGNHIDFVGDFGVTKNYFIRAVGANGQLGFPSDTVTATTFEMNDSMLLDMVQEYTFRYFYDFGHPTSGMARERNTTSTVTTGGTGFGIMALIVGVHREFITYEQARERTSRIVNFLMTVPRFKGAFSHWLNGNTGAVIPFSPQDDGGDLVETAFLMQGLLTAKAYFTGDTPEEIALRNNITQLWVEVNWNWYRQNNQGVLYWHWSPTNNFAINLPIRGFNETHIIYLLAMAAPNPEFAIPPSLYQTGWAGGAYESSLSYYGVPLLLGRGKGGPLFFTHYSYLGFDPRNVRDEYANYFEVNRNHTLINYEHCIDNPYNHEGYGPDCWGLTASDDPDGYLAHAPDNAQTDNGTITPTAALGSIVYTPEQSIRALKHFYRELGDKTWGRYGFYDAFNMDRNWYADSYLAIDQGPIICMIENYRSGLLWETFMQNPEATTMLEVAGFVPDSTTSIQEETPAFLTTPASISPNPASNEVALTLNLAQQNTINVDLIGIDGRTNVRLLNSVQLSAGVHLLPMDLPPNLPTSFYLLRITSPSGTTSLPLLIKD